jgi:eukaryotic-like serine/threonine-protein kinase
MDDEKKSGPGQPSTVPERRRGGDATVVVPTNNRYTAAPATPAAPVTPATADSYQPAQNAHTSVGGSPATLREVIVPSVSPVPALLSEIRKSPADRLDIQRRAASGGMGAIDVAVDRALDRRIALKTLHPHLRTNDGTVRMFLREARLTGLLDHPHIVPVYDIGERGSEQLYFTMKLVEGQTLSDVIRALPRGPLDTGTLYALLDVVAKVCDALAFAHSRGVLHCDIKPANVMVGEFGQVYLMDWGIARIIGAEASPTSVPNLDGPVPIAKSATDNSVIGTPCYMSPEQARGERASLEPRSDVFLIGSLLYELLTRRPPYASSDRAETLSLAVSGAFVAPRKVVKDASVPPELERIVLRAMAKKPEARYPTVAALREDLVRFMRGGGDFPRKNFAVGEAIVREGEQGNAAYIIVAGRCDIQKETPNGTETLQTIGPGAVFGEMTILTEGPRTATVVATEPTTVLVVTSAVLEQEMAALKPWMATLLKSLATRYRDIDTKHRATYSAGPSPTHLANQVLMIVSTWGETDAQGGRWMKWSALGAELEALLGLPPIAIFGVASRYGLLLDLEADRLTIPDVPALTAKLRAELGR